MKLIYSVLLLFIIPRISAQAKADDNNANGVPVRTPKLFYVYTLKTTSTVNTLTTCFVSTTTAITTACSTGRKKRALPIDLEDTNIKPSKLREDNEEADVFFDHDGSRVDALESTMDTDDKKDALN